MFPIPVSVEPRASERAKDTEAVRGCYVCCQPFFGGVEFVWRHVRMAHVMVFNLQETAVGRFLGILYYLRRLEQDILATYVLTPLVNSFMTVAVMEC